MLYLETSAMVKKYRREAGADLLRELLDSGEEVTSSVLTLAEVETTLGRLFREGLLQEDELHRQRAALIEDWSHVFVMELDDNVIAEVRGLVMRRPLRTGDAIHLASALLVAGAGEPLVFCSADTALLRSASAEGLSTWSPLAP